MTLLEDTVSEIISEFGETVTVIPSAGYDSQDDIWRSDQGYNEAESFEAEARVMRAVSNKELQEEGFSDKGESMAYFDEVVVEQGDIIVFDDSEWVVAETMTGQIGQGVYRQVISLRRGQM